MPPGLGIGELAEGLVRHRQALAVEFVVRALRRRGAAARVADLLQSLVDEVAAGRGRRPGEVLAASEFDETGARERRTFGRVVGGVQVFEHQDLRCEVGDLRAEDGDRVAVRGVLAVDHQRVAHVLGHGLQRRHDRGRRRVGRGEVAARGGVRRSAGQRCSRIVGECGGRRVDLAGDLVREGLVDDGRGGGRVVLLLELLEGARAGRCAELLLQVLQQRGVLQLDTAAFAEDAADETGDRDDVGGVQCCGGVRAAA